MIAQVDLAVWDMATVCGSCHVGGSLVEQDLAGTRLSQRTAPTDGSINAIDHYVSDDYDPSTGLPNFSVQPAPWNYPYPIDGNGDGDFLDPEDMPDFMMPNVREMDCFMCHLEGYNNVLNSAAVQMGYLNAAPSMSAGLTNMFAGGAYIPGTVELDTTNMQNGMAPATLSGTMLAKLKPEPPTKNCQQCHTPDNMANFTDMFEKFLSASPMEYNPNGAYASPLTGKALPSYDLNAAFVPPTGTSFEVFFSSTLMEWVYAGNESAAGPFGIFPMALSSSWSMFNGDGSFNTAAAGGGKPGMTGPLYYAGSGDMSQGEMPDQNAMKKSTIPFPKADWFKRGDLWENELEVHSRLGCGGCHYNGESGNADLNQCDPGRGHVRMGGIESGKTGIDTRDTVKTCKGCHITGTSINGTAINTFGAPNPTAAHTAAGLTAKIATAIGWDGSQEVEIPGDHLDVVDCTVCHIYKKTMAVRALDCTSGKRFPTLIGIDNSKGMMGMFTDPMTVENMSDSEAIGAFTNNMLAMGYTQAAIDGILGSPANTDVARAMLKNELQEWAPIYGWHANAPKTLPDGSPNPDWRRKIIPINFITAQLWDDSADSRDGLASPVDANGDGGESSGVDVKWDPWISRDMKAGMNFGNTGFATVPTGFGSGAYQSAYNADGTFTGAFDYVGIYGGNIILTNPDEISAYKTHRESIKGTDGDGGLNGRSWANTQLVFQGGNPFQVTHNVAPTSTRALGKVRADGSLGCTDCHNNGSDFFSGAYDMTGTAVPASVTYDVDGSGEMATAVESNMMQRPVVDYEVTALAEDLRTGSEAKRKSDGAVLDVEFEEHGCWNATDGWIAEGAGGCTSATHKRTTDLDRSEFLYPEAVEGSHTWTSRDGTQEFTQLGDWVTYLEGLSAAATDVNGDGIDDATGLGFDPVARITAVRVANSELTPTGGVYEVEKGVSVEFDADEGQNTNGTFSYNWDFNEGASPDADSDTATHTFNSVGTFQTVLSVTDEEGKIDRELVYVKVKAPVPGSDKLSYSAPTLTISGLPDDSTSIDYDTIRIYWGDGAVDILRYEVDPDDGTTIIGELQADGVDDGIETANHTYAGTGYTISVLVYKDGDLLEHWKKDI